MNVLQDISKISRSLMLSEPFYGLFLSTLNKVLDDRIPTAGVSKSGINIQLSVSPKFWEGLSENVRYGVLKHEITGLLM